MPQRRATGVFTITTVIDGSDGYSSAIVRLYRRSATVLTDSDRPTGTLTYTFATGVLSGPSANFNGWSQQKPSEDADMKLYVTMATATSRDEVDAIVVDSTASPAVNEWSTPVEYTEGLHSATVMLYRRSATALSAHGITAAVYYRFSDGKLFTTKAATTETAIETNKLNGWTRTVPATNGNPCYVIQATTVSPDALDKIGRSEWSNPVKYVVDGADGDGEESVFIRTKSSVAPKIIDTGDSESAYVYDNAKYMDSTGGVDNEDGFRPVAYVQTGSSTNPEIEANDVAEGMGISGTAGRYGECTPQPKGISEAWPYEWMMKRVKAAPDANGKRTWNLYGGGAGETDKQTMRLYGKWSSDAVRLDLDNQHEDFLYSGATTRVAPTGGATSQARLYDGPNEVSTGVTWAVCCGQSQGMNVWTAAGESFTTGSIAKAKISTGGLLTVDEIYADAAKVGVRATYKSKYYYAEFTANKTSQDKYDLKLTPNAIAFNSSETWADKTIEPGAERTDLQGNKTTGLTIQTTVVDGLRLYYSYVKTDGTLLDSSLNLLTTATFSLTQTPANTYIGIYFELRLYSGNNFRMCDNETVPIAKSANGADGTQYQRMYKSTNSGTFGTWDANTQPAAYTDNSNGWRINPTGISSTARYRWLTERSSTDGGTNWSDWSTPVIDAYLSEDGRSISIKGNAAGVIPWGESLPASANNGDLYLMNNNDADDMSIYIVTAPNSGYWDSGNASLGDGYMTPNGHLWLKVNNMATAMAPRWSDVGQIKGDKGDKGDANFVCSIGAMSMSVEVDRDGCAKHDYDSYIPLTALYGLQDILSQCTVTFSSSAQIGGLSRYNNSIHVAIDAGDETPAQVTVTITFTHSRYGSQTLYFYITTVMEGKQGGPGSTGKMCYIAGEYSDAITYTSNDSQTVAVEVPIANSSDTEPYLLIADTNVVNGVHIPPTGHQLSSSIWEQGLNRYNLLRTKYLFADFANLGSFIVTGDFFISQYGVIKDSSGNETVVNANNASIIYTNGSKSGVAYMWFSSTDPMATTTPAQGSYKFRPNKVVNALTGEEWMAGGNAHVDALGNVTMNNAKIEGSLMYHKTKYTAPNNQGTALYDSYDVEHSPLTHDTLVIQAWGYTHEGPNRTFVVGLPRAINCIGSRLKIINGYAGNYWSAIELAVANNATVYTDYSDSIIGSEVPINCFYDPLTGIYYETFDIFGYAIIELQAVYGPHYHYGNNPAYYNDNIVWMIIGEARK